MKTYSRLAFLILALGFIGLPSAIVTGSTESKGIELTRSLAQQKIAGKLKPSAVTFTVNSTLDSPDSMPGDGLCDDGVGNCTLRAALEESNFINGNDTINFNIPPSGQQTISPTSPLPIITDTVSINGTTQPGFSGTPIIELKGTSIGGAVILVVQASNCVIRGLVFNTLDGNAIKLQADNNHVVGNFIGTDFSGTAGGPGVADSGVSVESSGNTIGGTAPGDANVIAFNAIGVNVRSGVNNSIVGNSIFNSISLGIDLNNDLVTANDACDADDGPNHLQNFPTLTTAQTNLSVVAIQGTMIGEASRAYQIDFYASPGCSASGFGEGKTFIGSTIINTDASCNASINASFPVSLPGGQAIAATATDPSGNTSEFSNCIPVAIASCLLTCSPNLTRSTDANQCGAIVNYPPPDVSGPCGTVTCNPPAGSFFPKGATNINCSNGGVGNCSFTITIVDTVPPRITCPDNMVVPTDPGMGVAIVNYPFATFSDNCPGATAVCLPPSGTVFPLGVSSVACSAKDTALNTTTCSFTVTVKDTENPLITCPANIIVPPTSGQTSAVVTYPPPTVSDNLPGASVVCSPSSGSSFPSGTTTVVCTASDVLGNRAICSFIVMVGGPQAQVTLPANKTAVEFATVPPARKPPKPKKSPCSQFTIENVGFAPLILTFDSIKRTGANVTNGQITDPNDTRFFTVNLVNADQSLTELAPGGVLTLLPGRAQLFCIKFAALIPAPAGKTTTLVASDVLPESLTSAIIFRQNAGSNIVVPLLARVSTGLVLINPANPRLPATITFTRSGKDLTVSYTVFDPNLDVSRAKYEFLDAGGQVVAGPFEIDLAEPVRALNLIKGQSFSVEQRFTGASSSSKIKGVRVTVFDGETSAVGTASTRSASPISASSVELMKAPSGVTLYPSEIKIEPQFPR